MFNQFFVQFVNKIVQIDLTKSENIDRLTLIHQTDLQSAEAIISTQTFLPSANGWFGGGIYFANTIEAASKKANKKGVFLIADVSLGKVYPVHSSNNQSVIINRQQLIDNNYKGIIAYGIHGGREIIAFESKQVSNIKYCFGPIRPTSIFRTNKKLLTLFIVTNHQNAAQIVQSQKMIKTNGPFGHGCYLFDSITDALLVHPNEETYLAADVYMSHYCRLTKVIDIKRLPKNYRTFKGVIGAVQYFIIKKKYLVTHIHYCGGKNWN